MAGDARITVHLEGKGLAPQAVADAIVRVESLVNSIEGEAAPLLTITNLRGGSAHISMSVSGGAITELESGLAELRDGPVLPRNWGRESLIAVVGLAKVLTQRGVEAIELDINDAIASIDEVIQRNAEAALTPSSISLGAVRGVIYRYINDTTKGKQRRSAGLRRSDTGDAIELRFAPDNSAVLRNNLEAEVEVWGEIARDVTGHIAHITVEGVEQLDELEPATARDGRGLLGSEWTGGVDPVDWVRAQRG